LGPLTEIVLGDGTLAIAQKLFEKGINVIGVPKTIDNDLSATDVTFWFDTAVTTATEAIDKLHTTAESFLASKTVGPKGYVIGVDMTPEMVSKSRTLSNHGYTNVDFRLGEIENLPVADNTADVIISNCVINLSPRKQRVYNEAYRVLKKGGRLAISDIVLVKELTEEMKQDEKLYCG
jgi:SAM-dependent methyltransferase